MKESNIKTVEYSNKFLKSSKKLSTRLIKIAGEKETLFRANCFNPQLKTHKLSGKDKGCWAFWISNSHRIKFIFLSNEEVLFLEIGSHNIYK